MPIYEYQCESCGHEFEVLQKINDPRLTDCPQCQDASLKKKVSAAGFRLKGGGWYETDFKTGKKKNVAADSSAQSQGGQEKSGAKSGSGENGTSGASKAESVSPSKGTSKSQAQSST